MDQIKTVIFDLDNTLYNYDVCDEAGKKAVASYMKKRFGMEETEAMMRIQKQYDIQYASMNPQNAAVHSRLIRYQMIVEDLKKPLFPHVQAMTEAYWNTFYDQMVEEDGITDVLKILHLYGVEVAIGTNMTTWVQYEKLKRLKLGMYIDSMITSEEAEAEKPTPEFFDFCMKRLGRKKEECLFIGDSLVHDYEGATAYGMPTVWYAGAVIRKGKKEEPDHPFPAERINSYKDCLRENGLQMGEYLFSW